MFLAASASEGLKMLDFPVALSQVLLGIAGLLYAKKNRALIMKKVESGEYSAVQGKKKDKTFRLCSVAVLMIGCGLLVSWYLQR